MSQPRQKLKSWEVLLVVLSLLLLSGSAFVYLNHIPLRKYLFGINDGSSASGQQVGELSTSQGTVRRQTKTNAQFDLLNQKMELFLDDTVMTGPDSTARILLDDGGTLELSPNSMVRLNFDSKFSLTGVSRVPVIEILSGTVQAQAASQDIVVQKKNEPSRIVKATTTVAPPPRPKLAVRPTPQATVAQQAPRPVITPRALPALPVVPPSVPAVPAVPAVTPSVPAVSAPLAVLTPSPSPSPLAQISATPSVTPSAVPDASFELVQLQPRNGAKLTLPTGTRILELKQELKWKVVPDQPVQVIVTGKSQILKETVTAVEGLAGVSATLKAPGSYQWELLKPDGSAWPGDRKYQNSFTVSPDFQGIEILPPLVGGEAVISNQFEGRHLNDFDVMLRWKPYKNVKSYSIRISNSARKLLIEKNVDGEQYSFNKKRVYLEELYYVVTAKLKEGFVVHSKEEKFFFNFKSPRPTYPFSQATVSASAKAKGQQQAGVLFTWQKTNFTESYEFEIASDADFTSDIIRKVTPANFIVMKDLKPGRYFWRVFSVSNGLKSPAGTGFQITVTP